MVDKTFEDIGGFGRFQAFAYISISFGINCIGWWLYSLGYLIQEPEYECKINEKWITGDDCTVKKICAGDIKDYKINWDAENSMHNWWEKLDLLCQPDWKRNSIGTAFFIGWAFTLLWIPLLSDKHNRKKFFIGGNIADIICLSLMLFTSSVNVVITLAFMMGMISSFRINVGYIYLVELMPKKS